MVLLQTADAVPGAELEAATRLKEAIAILSSPASTRAKKRPRRTAAAATSDSADAATEEATEETTEETTMLLGELHMVLGRVIESKDPEAGLAAYASAHAVNPHSTEANFHYARLLWKCASTPAQMKTVENLMKCASTLAEREGDAAMQRDALELHARLLLQDDRSAEAFAILRPLGYTHSFTPSLAALRSIAGPLPLCGAKLRAAQRASEAVNVFDGALPPAILCRMRRALHANAPFWVENQYHSPRTGFFSFQHELPPFPVDAADTAAAAVGGLDEMLQTVWRVAARAVPAVKKARFVEWWAHARQHCYGHQIHFDSVSAIPPRVGSSEEEEEEEEEEDEEEDAEEEEEGGDGGACHSDASEEEDAGPCAPPRHPIISTITFLSAECGGPTLVTDQQHANERVTHGWLAHPKTNRLVCFDGSLLHCVLPGAGAAPSREARRTTFMVRTCKENVYFSHGQWFYVTVHMKLIYVCSRFVLPS